MITGFFILLHSGLMMGNIGGFEWWPPSPNTMLLSIHSLLRHRLSPAIGTSIKTRHCFSYFFIIALLFWFLLALPLFLLCFTVEAIDAALIRLLLEDFALGMYVALYLKLLVPYTSLSSSLWVRGWVLPPCNKAGSPWREEFSSVTDSDRDMYKQVRIISGWRRW